MTTDSKLILQKLESIKSDLDYLKEHMIDPDTIPSEDDIKAMDEAEQDLKEGRTQRL